MILIYLLFIHLNIHLHHYLSEVFRIILPQILYVMVPGNKVYFSVFSLLSTFTHSADPPKQRKTVILKTYMFSNNYIAEIFLK